MATAVRGLLAPWIGGASAPAIPCGPRSYLAYWMGGACVPLVTPEPPAPELDQASSLQRVFRVRPRHRREDEEILAVILAFLHMVNNE